MLAMLRPTWGDLEGVVRAAAKELLVCTPYYTEEGLGRLLDAIAEGPELTFVVRLSPSDWLRGVSDPEALHSLLAILHDGGMDLRLVVHQRLHAKVFLSDRTTGLVGSANLTGGGFAGNFELMVRVEGELAGEAARLVEAEIARIGRQLSVGDLDKWVASHKDDIRHLRTAEPPEADALAGMQRSLDEALGYGTSSQILAVAPMDDFVSWLEKHLEFPGAAILADRHSNRAGQNLTGHFRQCYHGVSRLLEEKPELVQPLASSLDSLGDNDLYEPDARVLEAWITHVDQHALDSGGGYDYAVLRGILPPSVGGTRMGGGGGISTLKRMMPLVARFLVEEGGG